MNIRKQTIMKKLLTIICLALVAFAAKAGDMSNSLELTQLYIVGDATPYSWDIGGTPDMQKIDEGVFRWTGKLTEGKEFKFMNSREWHKHIVSSTSDQKIEAGHTYDLDFYADRALDGSKDRKFKPAATGEYTVYVDLRSMKMTVYEKTVDAALPEKLYATGSALDGKTVEVQAFGGVEFKAALELKAGNIILMNTATPTASTVYYTPLLEGVDITFGKGLAAPLKTTTDAEAEGWSVCVPGKYTVYAVKDNNSVYGTMFKPCKELYVVGGCCQLSWNYWDSPSTIRFTNNPANDEEMVWEGVLNADWKESREEPSKLKILTTQSWFETTFHPYTADAPVEGTSNLRSTGGPDTKWTISRNGRYRLTVNTFKETLRGEYLGAAQTEAKDNEVTGINNIKRNDGSCDAFDICIVANHGTINVVSSSVPADVTVHAGSGQLVASHMAMSNGIVASNLSKGVYVVKATASGESVVKKVVVN